MLSVSFCKKLPRWLQIRTLASGWILNMRIPWNLPMRLSALSWTDVLMWNTMSWVLFQTKPWMNFGWRWTSLTTAKMPNMEVTWNLIYHIILHVFNAVEWWSQNQTINASTSFSWFAEFFHRWAHWPCTLKACCSAISILSESPWRSSLQNVDPSVPSSHLVCSTQMGTQKDSSANPSLGW